LRHGFVVNRTCSAILSIIMLSACGREEVQPIAAPIELSLRDQLHGQLKNQHRAQPYGWESILAVDGVGGRVELIYSSASRDATNHGGDRGEWNREHLWPRSYGIGNGGTDFTDLHNLRPCDVTTNNRRGNKYFAASTSTKTWEPPADEKGNIARALFYMAVRYEGDEDRTEDLELTETPRSGSPNFGALSTLLKWHQQDPPDDAERARNDRVEALQGNRNPFIDQPDLAGKIWHETRR